MENSKTLFKTIYLDPNSSADCKFLVGTTDNEEEIFGHKAIFANTSSVFNNMFFGTVPEKGDEIKVPDIQPEAFHTMVQFLYTGDLKITSVEHAVQVWYAAHKYDIKNLTKYTINYLKTNLTPTNACYIYEFANAFGNVIVMNKCQEIIVAEISFILMDPSFLEADLSVLELILDQDKLNVSELDLFKALVKYDDAHKSKIYNVKSEQGFYTFPAKSAGDLELKDPSLSNGDIDNSCDEESSNEDSAEIEEYININGSNSIEQSSLVSGAKSPSGDLKVKEAIVSNGNIDDSCGEGSSETREDIKANGSNPVKELIKKIRFLTMTPIEFGECLKISSLLSTSEALSILLNISDPSSTTYPMPEGFSTVKEKRDSLSINLVKKFPYLSIVSGPLIQKMRTITPKNLPSSVTTLVEYNKKKCYCNHAIEKSGSCLTINGLLEGSLIFQSDYQFLLTGVQLNNPTSETEPYAMDFKIEVLDSGGVILFSQSDSLSVPNDCFVEIPFDLPVYISGSSKYTIKVIFQNGGKYTRYNCSAKQATTEIGFNFVTASQLNCTCNGLIRSIVYTFAK